MGFQFKDGNWRDYDQRSDSQLKMAFMSGHPTCRVRHGRNEYEINFDRMTQTNTQSNQTREIRPPYKLKNQRPKAPLIPKGRTMMVKVPANAVAGTVIPVAHPNGGQFSVQLPPGAMPGSVLMVPVPDQPHVMPQAMPQVAPMMSAPAPTAPPAPYAPPANVMNPSGTGKDTDKPSDKISAVYDNPPPPKKGMSTGAKVATGVGVTAGVLGAGAIAGAVLIDQGVFGLDDVGDFFVDAGEGIADAFEDLGEGIVDLF
eukprot:GEMP01031645.1.p1 GENE.GEMP01031645.1~~GEMP01031645.1.p1  ORF type:complete len:268 (+),score=60.54 GEMP01031645.1:35-805(+)